MSWTTIRFKNSEFVAHDLLTDLWLFEVVRQIDNMEEIEPWLKELRDEWRLQATAGFGFGPTPELDRFVSSEFRRKQMLILFESALQSLASRNGYFTLAELILSDVGGASVSFTDGFPTDPVIEIGNQFLSILSK